MKRWTPARLWLEQGEEDSPVARCVRQSLPGVPVSVLGDPRAAEPAASEGFAAGKHDLVLQRHRGSFLQHCPAGTPGLVCCNYFVADFATNCPFDCSYCFLQEYLANNPAMKVFTNPEDGLAEIAALLRAHPARHFRIGTGHLSDSLALDPITGLSRILVPFFAEHRNAVLELKTKSDCVDELLRLDPRGRVVVSWSVNAPRVLAEEEPGTASLSERLAAARRVQEAGYRLGFHFDPLIEHPGWAAGYRDTVAQIAAAIEPRRIAWISLGSLRLTPGLRAALRARPRRSLTLSGELVACADGKARVWRGLRLEMYRRIQSYLRQALPGVETYLCMEAANVWQIVRGESPGDRQLAERLSAGALQ
ncbi:MAG: radical SAM protein [Deltaproteobacteria bacterium]|nr:radical SAM protein [Deltaproteobacteria bacterium]